MTAESDAKRIAAGTPPSTAVPAVGGGSARRAVAEPVAEAPYDPLRLCVYATVALLGWLAGPFALVVFAAVGFVGYGKARRAGLMRSRCILRDTRLVLAYFVVLIVAGGWGAYALLT